MDSLEFLLHKSKTQRRVEGSSCRQTQQLAIVLQFTTQLEQLWETFKSKCCNNQLTMIYNSNEASQLTAANTPAFYWKEQAQAPFLLLGGASHVWHRGKSSISASRKVTY